MRHSIQFFVASLTFLSCALSHAAPSTKPQFTCASNLENVMRTASKGYRGVFWMGPYAESRDGAAKAMILLPKTDCIRNDEYFCTETDGLPKIITTNAVYEIPLQQALTQFAKGSGQMQLKVTGLYPNAALYLEYRKLELKPKGFTGQWFSESGVLLSSFESNGVRGGYKEADFFEVKAKPVAESLVASAVANWEALLQSPIKEVPQVSMKALVDANKQAEDARKRVNDMGKFVQDYEAKLVKAQQELAEIENLLADLAKLEGQPNAPANLARIVKDYNVKKDEAAKEVTSAQQQRDQWTRMKAESEKSATAKEADLTNVRVQMTDMKNATEQALQSCGQVPSLVPSVKAAQDELARIWN